MHLYYNKLLKTVLKIIYFQFPTIRHPKQKRNYDPAQIGLAFKAVTDGKMSVYRAARVFGIPESTLRDRHLGLQPSDITPTYGPDPLFTMEEEKSLIEHMTYMSNIGYGYSRQAFLDMAFEYAVVLGKKSAGDPTFKGSWFQGFKRRWPDIHLVKPEKLAIVRAKATSSESLDKHFEELEACLRDQDILSHPERVWNIDETGIQFEHCPPKVLCIKGNTPQAVTSPRGKNVTLIGCANAVGACIPPYYIFPGKRWCDDLLEKTCPGASGEMSETGWSNSVTFQNYLSNHFLRFVTIEESKPHLVIFDGHKSHVSLSLTNWGKDHGLVFYILPPHTSHVTQPLDVACFGPLKAMYNIECQTYMRQNPGQTIDRYVVAQLSSKAYLKAFSPSNVVSAFKKTGIFPLCRDKIKDIKVKPAEIYQASEVVEDEQSGRESSPSTNEKHGDIFLEKQKIVAVTVASRKRKFVPPQIVGSLSSTKNTEILESKVPAKKTKPKSPKSPVKKPQTKLTKSPVPCCSKSAPHCQTHIDDESDQSLPVEDDEEVCCICSQRMPTAMNLAYQLEFVKWAQCDLCQHWTHLKFCSKVRVIRLNSEFLCPHCDASTCV